MGLKWRNSIAVVSLFFMFFQLFSPFGLINSNRAYAAVSLINPYKNYLNWYKGNLHAHSSYGLSDGSSVNNDDGGENRAEVANWYKNNGYDFYALTGHFTPYSHSTGALLTPTTSMMTITPDPNVGGIVWMGNSMENTFNTSGDRTECVHSGMINLSSNLYSTQNLFDKNEMIGKTSVMSNIDPQAVVDAVNDGGGITIFNHPYYTGLCSSTDAVNAMKQLDNLGGVEIYNSGVVESGRNATNPYSLSGNTSTQTSVWDEMLLSGKKVWGFGNDDGHITVKGDAGSYSLARGLAFNVVNSSEAASKDDILANIKAGNFYASTPTNLGSVNRATGSDYVAPSGFYNLKIESDADNITVSTTNGNGIKRVIGYKNNTVSETSVSSQAYTYTANGTEKYVRFEILNSSGKEVAWSQPVYVAAQPVASYQSPADGATYTTTSVGGNALIVGGLFGSATSPVSEKVSIRVEFKKLSDKNGNAVTDAWHNFGCRVSPSPDGSSDSSDAAQPLYSNCDTPKGNGVSATGWTDRNKDGGMDYVTSGSTDNFPGDISTLSLAAGTYTWALQAATETSPLTGIYSSWATGRTLVVVEPDVIAPTITAGPSTSSISETAADVSWTTNEASDTQVEYGPTTSYGFSTTLNSNKVTNHLATLSNLASSTTYHFRVKCRDSSGNLRTDTDSTFTTLAEADVAPPEISAVSSGTPGQNSATISWTTNEASDSQVEYGTSESYGSISVLNTTKVTSHRVTLFGLVEATPYSYRVKSRDSSGNQSSSTNNTFLTVANPDISPPTVSITSFADQDIISGTVSLSAEADDNVGVAKVEFYIGSTKLGEVTSEPYSYSFDTTTKGNGPFVFSAKAFDVSGNSTASTPVSVNILNQAERVPVTGFGIVPSTLSGTVAELSDYQLPYVLSPEMPTNPTVTWISSDETVAQVSKGSITPLIPGVATITGTTEDGSFSDTLELTILENPERYDITTRDNVYSESGVFVYFEQLPSNIGEGFDMSVSERQTFVNAAGDKQVISAYDLVPSRDLLGSFSATITLVYPEGVAAKPTDTVLYWNGSRWTNEGIDFISINLVNNYNTITFRTNHFSQYGIATASPVIDTTGGTAINSVPQAAGVRILPATGINANRILMNYIFAIIAYCLFALIIRGTRFKKLLFR